jgi:hypothetical protein
MFYGVDPSNGLFRIGVSKSTNLSREVGRNLEAHSRPPNLISYKVSFVLIEMTIITMLSLALVCPRKSWRLGEFLEILSIIS